VGEVLSRGGRPCHQRTSVLKAEKLLSTGSAAETAALPEVQLHFNTRAAPGLRCAVRVRRRWRAPCANAGRRWRRRHKRNPTPTHPPFPTPRRCRGIDSGRTSCRRCAMREQQRVSPGSRCTVARGETRLEGCGAGSAGDGIPVHALLSSLQVAGPQALVGSAQPVQHHRSSGGAAAKLPARRSLRTPRASRSTPLAPQQPVRNKRPTKG
jgi:hypothetical protein